MRPFILLLPKMSRYTWLMFLLIATTGGVLGDDAQSATEMRTTAMMTDPAGIGSLSTEMKRNLDLPDNTERSESATTPIIIMKPPTEPAAQEMKMSDILSSDQGKNSRVKSIVGDSASTNESSALSSPAQSSEHEKSKVAKLESKTEGISNDDENKPSADDETMVMEESGSALSRNNFHLKAVEDSKMLSKMSDSSVKKRSRKLNDAPNMEVDLEDLMKDIQEIEDKMNASGKKSIPSNSNDPVRLEGKRSSVEEDDSKMSKSNSKHNHVPTSGKTSESQAYSRNKYEMMTAVLPVKERSITGRDKPLNVVFVFPQVKNQTRTRELDVILVFPQNETGTSTEMEPTKNALKNEHSNKGNLTKGKDTEGYERDSEAVEGDSSYDLEAGASDTQYTVVAPPPPPPQLPLNFIPGPRHSIPCPCPDPVPQSEGSTPAFATPTAAAPPRPATPHFAVDPLGTSAPVKNAQVMSSPAFVRLARPPSLYVPPTMLSLHSPTPSMTVAHSGFDHGSRKLPSSTTPYIFSDYRPKARGGHSLTRPLSQPVIVPTSPSLVGSPQDSLVNLKIESSATHIPQEESIDSSRSRLEENMYIKTGAAELGPTSPGPELDRPRQSPRLLQNRRPLKMRIEPEPVTTTASNEEQQRHIFDAPLSTVALPTGDLLRTKPRMHQLFPFEGHEATRTRQEVNPTTATPIKRPAHYRPTFRTKHAEDERINTIRHRPGEPVEYRDQEVIRIKNRFNSVRHRLSGSRPLKSPAPRARDSTSGNIRAQNAVTPYRQATPTEPDSTEDRLIALQSMLVSKLTSIQKNLSKRMAELYKNNNTAGEQNAGSALHESKNDRLNRTSNYAKSPLSAQSHNFSSSEQRSSKPDLPLRPRTTPGNWREVSSKRYRRPPSLRNKALLPKNERSPDVHKKTTANMNSSVPEASANASATTAAQEGKTTTAATPSRTKTFPRIDDSDVKGHSFNPHVLTKSSAPISASKDSKQDASTGDLTHSSTVTSATPSSVKPAISQGSVPISNDDAHSDLKRLDRSLLYTVDEQYDSLSQRAPQIVGPIPQGYKQIIAGLPVVLDLPSLEAPALFAPNARSDKNQ